MLSQLVRLPGPNPSSIGFQTVGLQRRKPCLGSAPVRAVSNYSLDWLLDEKRQEFQNLQQRRTIILLCETAEELMTAQFDLRLTNLAEIGI